MTNACSILWKSLLYVTHPPRLCGRVGYQNCMISPQTTHCAGLPTVGGGTPFLRMDLDSPCVPVGWRVALFGGLSDEVGFGLDGGRLGGPRMDILQSGANVDTR